jgi:pimeloyl-ACP methyl ester carboxylesterase
VAAPRLVLPPREQHLPVTLEDALDAWDRVRVVVLEASLADAALVGGDEVATATRAEPPAFEETHVSNSRRRLRDHQESPNGRGRLIERVVLLHSALGDSRLWKRQVPALAGRFDVVAPDLPGWGDSPLPREPFSFVDFVAGFLPGNLVGNSFGGMVALRTALARQELVRRLVLVGAGMPDWTFTEEMRTYFDAEAAAIDGGDLDGATAVNLDFWVAPEHHDEVRPQQRRALELQTAHDEPETIWPELAPLSSLRVPTLVVVGENDKADFRAIAQHLAEEIPDADLAIVPAAGHLVGVDQSEELNALLLEFLSE